MIKNYSDYYQSMRKIENFDTDKPHGWIQWKGTDVCIDLHCKCGYHGHVDTDFFYYYQCPKCLAKFCVGAHVTLIEMTPDQIAYHKKHDFKFKTCELEDGEEALH